MNPSPSAAPAGPIAKPPLLPSPRLAIQRFGEHEPGTPTVYIFFDVLDELLFHARFRAEPSAVLLTGGWYAGGAGPYIEVQGFMEAMYVGCTRDWLTTLQHRYAILHAHLAATSPQVSILGWAHGAPASRARMDIEALRVHLSFFNLPHQIYLAIDPDTGELAVYRRGAEGAMRNIGFNVVARRRDVERIARDLNTISGNGDTSDLPGPRESSVAWQAAMSMLGAELGRAGRQTAEPEPTPLTPAEPTLQPPVPGDSEPTRVRGATAIGIPAMVDEDWSLGAPAPPEEEVTRAQVRTPPPAPQRPPPPPDEVTQAIPRDDTAISIPPGSELARSVLTPSPPASPARRMVDERAVEAEIQAAVEAARQRQRPAGAPPTEDSFISALKSIMESTSKRAPREAPRPSSAEQLASLLPPPSPSRPAPGELFHYRRIAELPEEATRVEPTPPPPPPPEPTPEPEPTPSAAAPPPPDEPEEWQYTISFGSGRYRSVSREEAEQLRQEEATTLSPTPVAPPPPPDAPPPPPESRPGDPAERERLRRILGVVRDALVEKHVEQSGTRWPVFKPIDEAPTPTEPTPPDGELARSGSRPPSGAELKAKLDQLRKLRDSGRHYTIERDRAFKKTDEPDEPDEPDDQR